MAERYHFELLAPAGTPSQSSFPQLRYDCEAYSGYLDQLSRLRGAAYLEDGAIQDCDLDSAGCFHMTGDEASWHLLLIENDTDTVIACARYLVHPNTATFDELSISRCVLALDPEAGPAVRRIIEADMLLARRENLTYVEVGGWAIAKRWRGTRAALDIMAGSYALGELWGGSIGLCTATFRHGSASIIRRFSGATSASDVSPFTVYYDPHYGCPMELLRFKSRAAERFAGFVDSATRCLEQVVPLTSEPIPQSNRNALPRVA